MRKLLIIVVAALVIAAPASAEELFKARSLSITCTATDRAQRNAPGTSPPLSERRLPVLVTS